MSGVSFALAFLAYLGAAAGAVGFLATRRAPLERAATRLTVAGVLLKGLYPAQAVAKSNLGTPALGPGVTFAQGVVIETILTFLLLFTIFGVAVDPRAPQHITGFCIGLTVAFDILAGGPLSGASMNPARTFGPALAAGCTVVLKPAPATPLTSLKLAELASEAGIPPGAINVVTGGNATGQALVEHPGVRMVSLTGSPATGRRRATSFTWTMPSRPTPWRAASTRPA